MEQSTTGGEYGTDEFFELAAHFERAISALYATFAEEFPEHKDFWERLAADEEQHALWLESFPDLLEATDARPSGLLPSRREMNEGLDFVEHEALHAASNDIDHSWALKTAGFLEISYSERDFPGFLIGGSDAVRDLLHKILTDEREHIRLINEAEGSS
jgi:hypothetical protein